MVQNTGERVADFVQETLDSGDTIVDTSAMLTPTELIGRNEQLVFTGVSYMFGGRGNDNLGVVIDVVGSSNAPKRIVTLDDSRLTTAEAIGGDAGGFAVAVEQELLLDDFAERRKELRVGLGIKGDRRAADLGDLRQFCQRFGQVGAPRRRRTEQVQAAQISVGMVVRAGLVQLRAYGGQEALRNGNNHC